MSSNAWLLRRPRQNLVLLPLWVTLTVDHCFSRGAIKPFCTPGKALWGPDPSLLPGVAVGLTALGEACSWSSPHHHGSLIQCCPQIMPDSATKCLSCFIHLGLTFSISETGSLTTKSTSHCRLLFFGARVCLRCLATVHVLK